MISIIAAKSLNGVIGNGGKIPWRLPSDLKRFRKLTFGNFVVMGRKTFESLPETYRPLPGRKNIVVSTKADFQPVGVRVIRSLTEIINFVPRAEEVFVIGGEQIYKLALPYADRIYLTTVQHRIAGDTFFPDFNADEWQTIGPIQRVQDSEDEYRYTFQILERSFWGQAASAVSF